MKVLNFYKVLELPTSPVPNSLYFVKDLTGVHLYITEDNGIAEPVIEDGLPLTTDWVRTITIEYPSSFENIAFFFTDEQITIHKLSAVLKGTSSPSLTWTIKYDTLRNASGTEVVIGGSTTTSVTGSQTITSFDNAVIPANRILWIETSAVSGTIEEASITMIYART